MSRLETFADAALAFALTLIVISIDQIPESFQQLSLALRSVPAFAASFAIVVMFWLGHRTWSQRYGMDDARSTLLTLVLVFTIMVYVYPLRVVMTEALNSITGGWVPTSFSAETYGDVRILFLVYSAGWTLASLTLLMMFRHAYACRRELDLSAIETFDTRVEIIGWMLLTGAGIVSIIIALFAQGRWISLAGWIYAGLGVLMPLHGYIMGRRRGAVATT